MNIKKAYSSKGVELVEIVVTDVRREGVFRPEAKRFFADKIIMPAPSYKAPSKARGNLEAPAMDFGAYAQAFPRYHKEREKELNRLHPEYYASKSWFTKAVADKLGTDETRTLERLAHRLSVGQIGQEAYDKAVSEIKASTERAAQERVDAELGMKASQRIARQIRLELLKAWEGNNGPAMPQGKEVNEAEKVEFRRKNAAKCEPEAGLGLGVHNEGVKHGGVANGMEGRSARGKGDLHGPLMTNREEKALDLAHFELEVRKAEAEALKLVGKPGGSKAHKKAIYLRETYEKKVQAFKSGGFMGRMHGFENSVGRKSSKSRAEGEKARSEGRKDYR